MVHFTNPFSNKGKGREREPRISGPISQCPNCLGPPILDGYCKICQYRNGDPMFSQEEPNDEVSEIASSDISPKNMTRAKGKQPEEPSEDITSYQRNYEYGTRDDHDVSPVSSNPPSPVTRVPDNRSLAPSDSASNYAHKHGGRRGSIAPPLPAPPKPAFIQRELPPEDRYPHGYGVPPTDSIPATAGPSRQTRRNESFIQRELNPQNEVDGSRGYVPPPALRDPNDHKDRPSVWPKHHNRGGDIEMQDIDLERGPEDNNALRTRNFWRTPEDTETETRSRWKIFWDNIKHDCFGVSVIWILCIGLIAAFVSVAAYYSTHHLAVE